MEKNTNRILDAIQSLIDESFNGNVKAAAEEWGIPNDNLSKWLNKKRSPKLEFIMPAILAVAKSYAENMTLEELDEITSISNVLGIKKPVKQIKTIEDDYALIPKVSAVAGAGSSLETDADVTGYYAFRKEFLRRVHINAEKSVMMLVRGDSMEPLIRSGDTVLFDESDTIPKDAGIYVLTYGDELVVKKLLRIPIGWEICSLNPVYPPVKVQGDEINQLNVRGRVRWFGRVLD